MQVKDVDLSLIRIGGLTQQRPVETTKVDEYAELMTEGVFFPPVEVFYDGKDYWLWDGFHRYHAASKNKYQFIKTSITKGTQRDAIWYSFSANKMHGLPRQRGVAKEIIGKILTDKEWSRTTLSAIASHVGISRQYIQQVKDDMAAHGASSCTIAHGVSSNTIARCEVVEVERDGKKFTQQSQEKEHRQPDPITDKLGNKLPEKLQEVFLRAGVIQDIITQLNNINQQVVNAFAEKDVLFAWLNPNAFKVDIDNLKRALNFTKPYAICPYCGGEQSKSCKACKGVGFVNKLTYEAAPEELK